MREMLTKMCVAIDGPSGDRWVFDSHNRAEFVCRRVEKNMSVHFSFSSITQVYCGCIIDHVTERDVGPGRLGRTVGSAKTREGHGNLPQLSRDG